jgi:hypothetical protein
MDWIYPVRSLGGGGDREGERGEEDTEIRERQRGRESEGDGERGWRSEGLPVNRISSAVEAMMRDREKVFLRMSIKFVR